MKLCIVTSSYPASRADARASAGLFVRDFCLALADLGHQVTVLTPEFTGIEKIPDPGLEVHWFPRRGSQKRLSYLKLWKPRDLIAILSIMSEGRKSLDRLAQNAQFDHIMAMWAVPSGWLARGLSRRSRIPYSVWCLGSDIWVYGRIPILRQAVKSAICSAQFVYADGIALADEVKRLTERECHFLPSSRRLDYTLIFPVPRIGIGTQFLFVGRYADVKGVDILLEAMARYRATGRQGRLTMFGGGPIESFVRRRASQPDLAGSISVNGYADEAQYVSHLAASDCLLIPSRMESIPVVLADAAQMGRPVIASDVGDMGALIRLYHSGIAVPPQDSGALCDAMIRFSESNPALYCDGATRLAGQFDITRVAREWIAAVQGIPRLS